MILRSRIFPVVAVVLIMIFCGVLFRTKLLETSSIDTASKNQAEPVETLHIETIHTGKIARNSNLYAGLLNLEIPQPLVAEITSRFSRMYDLRHSQAGDTFKLFMGPSDSVIAFEYITGDWQRYRMDRDGNDYIESISEIGLDRVIRVVEGEIDNTLWDALMPLLPDMGIFYDMIEIFGWDIDFLTEPRIGDSFKIIFETYEKDGMFIKSGRILAAEYVLEGAPHRAFFFTDPNGHQDYFDENGFSLRRALLKSPLNHRRISSKFSHRRLHPIYKIYRPHLGVDYAAPIGTPIVAAGDGHVIYKGKKKGFGLYLEIKHSFGLVTCYGHLRNFARGIAKDRRVVQGQLIGYVGNTGESTGPHLDYRVRRNGKYVNPLKMTIPASMPVKEEYKDQFDLLVAKYLPQFQDRNREKLFVRLD